MRRHRAAGGSLCCDSVFLLLCLGRDSHREKIKIRCRSRGRKEAGFGTGPITTGVGFGWLWGWGTMASGARPQPPGWSDISPPTEGCRQALPPRAGVAQLSSGPGRPAVRGGRGCLGQPLLHTASPSRLVLGHPVLSMHMLPPSQPHCCSRPHSSFRF